jgi:hypothetical protein
VCNDDDDDDDDADIGDDGNDADDNDMKPSWHRLTCVLAVRAAFNDRQSHRLWLFKLVRQ